MAGDQPRTTIDDLLAAARARLDRVTAEQALAVTARAAVIVDVRPLERRRRPRVVPARSTSRATTSSGGSTRPASGPTPPSATPERASSSCATRATPDKSLAAVTLHELGFARATDMIDGFDGWRAAGLQIEPFDEQRHAYDRPSVAGHDD